MEFILDWFRPIGQAVRHATTGHPTENTLIEIALLAGGFISDAQGRHKLEKAQEHMRRCNHCEAILSEINATLKHIKQSAPSSVYTIPEVTHRRYRQRSEILRRIDRFLAPPATLLHFPSTPPPSLTRFAPLSVCLVIACATGPFLGIAMRQSVISIKNLPSETSATPQNPQPGYTPSPPTDTARLELHDLTADEQFMAKIEYAVGTPRVSPLFVLDELTPRLREASVTVR